MIKRRFLALTTAGVLAVGGLAACGSSSSTTSTTATTSGTASGQTANGQAPTGRPPAGRPGMGMGMGAPVTGSAATEASNAATAKYAGTAERVLKVSDGSYVVHVLTSTGEVRVKVSKAFAVTGVQQGAPPQGTAPQSSSAATA
jgi:hypothetical protein